MYTNTKIWHATLGRQDDPFDQQRERLRQTYFGFRERVGQLIQTIPQDSIGLTVHDLTHLDALWEMADLLTNGDYVLNPAEAFVLGGAILLHDSAMTVCAYSGGIDEIKQTAEYADALAQLLSFQPIGSTTRTRNTRSSAEQYALSEALRMKHAGKAEELASQKWLSPIDGSEIYLIDDGELRDHYSRAIGRIAHSHHWNITDVSKVLGTTLGAFSSFPSEWTIDQVKVALLLRCIDAMQIDDRRAPRLLAAIRPIGAESMTHWRFQNKLTQPHLEDGRLVYTSKSPFKVNEATAWNLCFDTLQMIDRELRDTNDLHLQKGLPPFRATGVAGAGSAEALARYIEVDGWRPLPLNLKVSNVPQLARTLGGRDLYNNQLTPLRELIQNSADAIEARVLVENDFTIDDGVIAIRFIDAENETFLEIDDNGVGMSERVLTSALLDFGFSFWKSAAARAEFPGIQSEVNRFRGRYGIGFFSVFMWSSEVVVCSRRFNEGIDVSRVLEFRQGIESRPILRSAEVSERSSKWTTRVRLKLNSDFFNAIRSNPESELMYAHRVRMYGFSEPIGDATWTHRAKLLCGALPIKVTLEAGGRTDEVSLPTWRNCPHSVFMDFFSDVVFRNTTTSKRFITTLTALSAPPPSGGRCFVSPYDSDGSLIAVYDKGIFVGFERGSGIQGIAEASTTNAARDRYSQLSIHTDTRWIDEVRPKAFAACRHIGETLAIQKLLLLLGAPDPNHPLFIKNRQVISLFELKRQVAVDGVFHIRLPESHDNRFLWKVAEKLSTLIGLEVNERRVYPLVPFAGEVQSTTDIDKLVDNPDEPLFRLLRDLRDVLGPSAQVKSEHHELDGYQNDYIDIFIITKPDAQL